MRFVISSNGKYYHIIEELVCPFNEKKDYIILEDDEIMYWRSPPSLNAYYNGLKFNIEMLKKNIIENEIMTWRSEERKKMTLDFLRETLSKMIAYKREIKIDEVLNKTQEEIWS
jgi:hypothetical protein